jgi:cell division transport system permease protein
VRTCSSKDTWFLYRKNMQFVRTSASSISRISAFAGSTLVLLMVGIFLVFYLVALQVSDHIRSQFTVQLLLNDEVSEEQILSFKKEIEGGGIASQVSYTSSEQAEAEYSKEIGEDFVQVLGYNPLPASIDVQINPEKADGPTVDAFVESCKQNSIIKDVGYEKTLLQSVNENISKWGAIIGGIVILFLIISAFIIMNTVELAISSQRLIIRSMQLVGATPWFIKRPFLWQSLKNALLSSTIAWLSISLILYFNQQSLADIIQILLDGGGFWKLGALLITLSVVVGVSSTYITVSRFVRAKLHQMY